ncbi:hypothetical protein [Kutzneria sp. NPDC052558]|uniref:hypothetical protein n=1 Tax=Kutzneria sp. NPDC052558 TaxID=3364121 RepID=UPI0037C7152A
MLAVAHTVASAQALLEIRSVIGADLRVQLLFTVAPDVFADGVVWFLRARGEVVLPWSQAVRLDTDVVVAAGYGGLTALRAPIVVLPHGAGYGKYVPLSAQRPLIAPAARCLRPPAGTPPHEDAGRREVYGLDCGRLARHGRVVPATIALSHHHQRDLLAAGCPCAVAATAVIGDLSWDRMTASVGLRAEYRAALGIGRRRLILIASTWGPHALLARHPQLYERLAQALCPDQHMLAGLLHPAAWTAHGRQQIQAWLSSARHHGLALIDPWQDWRALLVAADGVIGDHGSITTYAAALGRPVLQADLAVTEVHERSPQALLALHAPHLRISRDLAPQIHDALDQDTRTQQAAVAAALTSHPGQAHRLLREILYGHLRLSAPAPPATPPPLSPPSLSTAGDQWR